MQYLTLYIVLLFLILFSFVRGKDFLFKIIIMAYPAIVIYKSIVEYFSAEKINKLLGLSAFLNNLILFLIILIPVYIAMHRIIESYRVHHNVKGILESVLLSLGIVLLTIGICFHVLPDKDIFNLDKPFEIFFQTNLGFMVSMIVPMISVFLMSKKSVDL